MQNRDFLKYADSANPTLNDGYHYLFSAENKKFISDEVSYKLNAALPGNHGVKMDAIENALSEFYSYAYEHPQVITQKVINLLVDLVLKDKQHQDNSHLDPWIQVYDGNHGLKGYDTVKLNHRRHTTTLEFTVQR
jgi:hypothetical protein